jgi:hypothetical protein
MKSKKKTTKKFQKYGRWSQLKCCRKNIHALPANAESWNTTNAQFCEKSTSAAQPTSGCRPCAQLRENAEAEVFWISTTFLVADLSHRSPQRTNRRVRSILNSTVNIHRLHLGVARTGLQNMPKIYPPPLL